MNQRGLHRSSSEGKEVVCGNDNGTNYKDLKIL